MSACVLRYSHDFNHGNDDDDKVGTDDSHQLRALLTLKCRNYHCLSGLANDNEDDKMTKPMWADRTRGLRVGATARGCDDISQPKEEEKGDPSRL